MFGCAAATMAEVDAKMTAVKGGCQAYGGGLRLMALQRELDREDLSAEERARLEAEAAELERELGLD